MSINSKKTSDYTLSSRKSNKSRISRVSVAETPALVDHPEDDDEKEDIQPKFLGTETIILRGDDAENLLQAETELTVPTCSPRSDFIIGGELSTIPKTSLSVQNLDIPYVRILGIRKCIEILGEFFGCTQYSTNTLQFWFLDMVTDCIWRCQDEFLLSRDHQRVVLQWVLYIFDIIRDPTMNFSRGQLFRLFREAIAIAEDKIESGDGLLPPPDSLFTPILPPENLVDFESLLSDSSNSSLSFSDSSSDNSFIVIPSEEYPDLPEFHRLPKEECKCNISISSSIESLSEKSIYLEEDERASKDDQPHYNSEADFEDIETYSISEFYQPERKLHSRFLEELEEEDDQTIDQVSMGRDAKSDVEYIWIEHEDRPQLNQRDRLKSATLSSQDVSISISSGIRRARSIKSKSKGSTRSGQEDTKSQLGVQMKKTRSKASKEEKKLSQQDILDAWLEYNIWQQRIEDMANPSKGWMPADPDDCDGNCKCAEMEYTAQDFLDEEYIQVKKDWQLYLEKHKFTIEQTDENKFINSCLLLVIKQFVIEYFYESFQYKLIKLTYQTPPNLILERLNREWPTPKVCKEEFRRPAEKKPKPEKSAREKKTKVPKDKKAKGKKEKKSKSTKSSVKKEKKHKQKAEKTTKDTKEDKEKLLKLKREEEKRIEDEIIAEENRRLIFPLNLAANELFFRHIFDNYAKSSDVKLKGKTKKNKGKTKDSSGKKSD